MDLPKASTIQCVVTVVFTCLFPQAEVAVLRSERNLLRKKAEAPENKRGIGPKQAFTTYNFSALTQEVKRLTMQLSEEAAVLMHDIQRELLDNVHLIPL
jgi:hypothetical protein